MKNIRSFTKMLNKIGPNIDSCGIPLRISRYELKVDIIFPVEDGFKVIIN